MENNQSSLSEASLELMWTVCQLSGLCHDLGKATVMFQNKLLNPSLHQKDPIRHEWISLRLLDALLSDKNLNEAFTELVDESSDKIPFNKQAQGLIEVVRFSVATHHGLFAPRNQSEWRALGPKISNDSHIRAVSDHPFNTDPQASLSLEATFETSLEQCIYNLLSEINSIEADYSGANRRYLSTFVRAMLILSDHTVSARIAHSAKSALYANTAYLQTKSKRVKRKPNQDLNYHLREVGKLAASYAHHLHTYQWKGIDQATCHQILTPTPNRSAFSWQNRACSTLRKARSLDTQVLVLNVAGTGTGKTRMNMKAAIELNRRQEVRVTTALNLRTLTLQTGRAYQSELKLNNDDVSCVIGDSTIKKLHQNQYAESATDENPKDRYFEGTGETGEVPEWLKEYAELNPKQFNLINKPVLVSTIDFIIAAGEPHRQGHHAAALVRLSNSDLILDEIDEYDPTAFIAVLRLVEMAAFLGANIITSSATLPTTMAHQLMRVFASGVAGANSLRKMNHEPAIVFIDDKQEGQIHQGDEEAITSAYKNFILPDESKGKTRKRQKIPALAPLSEATEACFLNAIERSVNELHDNHSWYTNSNKRISIGLVRIANIKTAIRVARELSARLPNDYISCYHSNDFLIQRFRKELILDSILNRKAGNNNLENSTYIQDLLAKNPKSSIKLIVVATPVEEVGRDHDFDWAVIEPSSARSIVQTAGRVNRHRQILVDKPNIHILQYNFRKCVGKEFAFCYPGFEVSERWPSHDLAELIDWDNFHELTTELRFGHHPFAKYEDQELSRTLETPVSLLLMKRSHNKWMSEYFYRQYPLREDNKEDRWTMRQGVFHLFTDGALGVEPQSRSDLFEEIPQAPNSFLNWSIQELLEFAQEMEIEEEKAFELIVPRNLKRSSQGNEEGQPHLIWDHSFGIERWK